ncbi:MAG: hypothetical protein J0M24_19655 [Verrucomicrobia bacterium]|nr:hypothetical protein [Verrucomicrobiota bacterium]
MRPDKKPHYYQAQLPLPKKSIWERFPESKRLRCRHLLVQMLQEVTLGTSPERKDHE